MSVRATFGEEQGLRARLDQLLGRSGDLENLDDRLEDLAGEELEGLEEDVVDAATAARYPVEEELVDRSPTADVRRPRLDYDSRAIGPDRNEVGAHRGVAAT